MAGIFQRDAERQHSKDFKQQNILNMKQHEQEMKQKM